MDRDVVVDPHAVADLTHLLAELIENAVTFSPPDTRVSVRTQWTQKSVLIRIEDHGIGISESVCNELNRRLSKPSQDDLANSRMIGITVVARLAARHQIGVRLIPAVDRGTVAEVLLPLEIAARADRRPGAPDRQIRAILAELPADKATAMVRCFSADQLRQLYAGRASERAEGVLDGTRSPNWPAVDFSPSTLRPGFREGPEPAPR
jgi:hypothetical protein